MGVKAGDLPVESSPLDTDFFLHIDASGNVSKCQIINVIEAAVGELLVDTDNPITCTVQNDWYGWDQAQAGALVNVTADALGSPADTLEVDSGYAGLYEVKFAAEVENTGAQSGDFEVGVFVDSETTARFSRRRSLGAGDIGSISNFRNLTLSVGQKVSIKVRCTSNSNREIALTDVTFAINKQSN